MVMTLAPDNTLQPCRVLRAMFFAGRVAAPGDDLRLPRSTAYELRAAGKVEFVAAAAEPAEPPPAAPRGRRAPKADE